MPKDKYLPPVHPGEILFLDFMEPMGLSQNRLANELGVPPRRINEIIHGKRAITADTAIRLSRYFGTSPQLWMNLQTEYELDRVVHAERTHGGHNFDAIRPCILAQTTDNKAALAE